ncbi:protein eyes shut homolog [Ciona intestinalis]
MPCAGNANEMCGGVWRNSVYRTGVSQRIEGSCGGFPGYCHPWLNGKEQLKLDLHEDHPCLIQTPCYNSGLCLATDIGQFTCICHKGYTGTYCEVMEQPLTLTSDKTATNDDANAYVSCPAGMAAVKCECADKNCDGAWFEENECEVTNSGLGTQVRGSVTCMQYDPTYQRFINVGSKDMKNPVAQCPDGAYMTGCAALDWWHQQVTYGRGVVDNSTTPATCKQDYCKTTANGCKVQARCLLSDCGCRNGGTCVHISGQQCACPDGFYGTFCESFDYCGFYEDTLVVEPMIKITYYISLKL